MASRNRNVVDPQIRLVSTPQLKTVFLVIRPNYVDDSRGDLLLVETLEHQKVALWSFVVHQVVGYTE